MGGKLPFEDRDPVRDPVEEGHDEVDAGAKHRMQPAEAFDDEFLGLRHDLDPAHDNEDQEQRRQQDHQIVLQQGEDHVFHGFSASSGSEARNRGRIVL